MSLFSHLSLSPSNPIPPRPALPYLICLACEQKEIDERKKKKGLLLTCIAIVHPISFLLKPLYFPHVPHPPNHPQYPLRRNSMKKMVGKKERVKK